MLSLVYKIYGYLFAKPIFRKLNMFLYHISLRGLGILNYENEYLTGEKAWLKNYLKNKKNPIVLDVGANVGIIQNIFLSLMTMRKFLLLNHIQKIFKNYFQI